MPEQMAMHGIYLDYLVLGGTLAAVVNLKDFLLRPVLRQQ